MPDQKVMKTRLEKISDMYTSIRKFIDESGNEERCTESLCLMMLARLPIKKRAEVLANITQTIVMNAKE